MIPATFNNLEVMIPENWDDYTTIILKAPTPPLNNLIHPTLQQQEAPSIVIRKIPSTEQENTLDEFMEEHVAALEVMFEDWQFIDKKMITLSQSNADAIISTYSYSTPSGIDQQKMLITYLDGHYVFATITYCADVNAATITETFLSVCDSLKIK